jgi:UDP:flavonoid glycosyltransferase YjiC (YdhE family)
LGKRLFILNPIGTAGDVHPYLAVGGRLRSRGHDVLLISEASFRSVAQQVGIDFVSVGERVDWNSVAKDSRVHRRTAAWKEAMQWGAVGLMREVYSKIAQNYRPGETVIASPLWSLGARNARDRLKIPHVSFVLNPFLLRSMIQSPVVPMMYLPDWMPTPLKRWQYFVADHAVTDPVMLPETNQFRRELKLEPVRRIMKNWWFSPDLVLGLFDEFLVPRQPDWPSHVELVGHTTWDPEGEPSEAEEMKKFLAAGPPPVLFVPGSVGAGNAAYWIAATEACVKSGNRGVFLTRFDDQLPELPASIAQFNYVAMKHVARRCKAIVHSGCMGTLSHALAAGLPQIVRPVVNDQFDNAARLERLGVGKIISTGKFSAKSLGEALTRFAESRSVRRRCHVVSSWSGEDSIRTICDEMEYLLYRTQQSDRRRAEVSIPARATGLLRTEIPRPGNG